MPSINIAHLLLGGAVLISAIPSLGNLGQLSGQISEARTEAKRISSDMVELKLSQQEAEQKASVAIQRYEGGWLTGQGIKAAIASGTTISGPNNIEPSEQAAPTIQ